MDAPETSPTLDAIGYFASIILVPATLAVLVLFGVILLAIYQRDRWADYYLEMRLRRVGYTARPSGTALRLTGNSPSDLGETPPRTRPPYFGGGGSEASSSSFVPPPFRRTMSTRPMIIRTTITISSIIEKSSLTDRLASSGYASA